MHAAGWGGGLWHGPAYKPQWMDVLLGCARPAASPRWLRCVQPTLPRCTHLVSLPPLTFTPSRAPTHAPLVDGLWWLGGGRAVNALRRLLLLVALAVFLLAIEERVVFHSFNQYIRLTAPWNYVAVTGELT